MKPLVRQFARFAMCGGVAACVHFALMWALVRGGCGGVMSTSSGYAIGACVSYQLHRRVFFRGDNPLRFGFMRYASVVASGACLNALVVFVLTTRLGVPLWFAQATASLCVLISNFTGAKWMVFKSPITVEAI